MKWRASVALKTYNENSMENCTGCRDRTCES